MLDYNDNERVLFGVKVTTIQDLPTKDQDSTIVSLRIMHSPQLVSMLGISQYKHLKHLNLAQNNIQKIEGLQQIQQLQTLNLAGNKIKSLTGLEGLHQLQMLNLSYNKIISLSPLQIFANQSYSLAQIDFRCNLIQDLNELSFLQGYRNKITSQLLELQRQVRQNPICLQKTNYLRAILSLTNLPNLKLIDRMDVQQLKLHALPAPITNPVKPLQERNQIPQDYEQQQRDKTEIILLQNKVNELNQQLKEFTYKFDCNEKYWTSRCQTLEKEVIDHSQNINDLHIENKDLRKEIAFLKDQAQQELNEKQNLIAKKDRKEELINQLQIRVSDLLQENGRLQKETSTANETTEKIRVQLTEREKRYQDVKSSLKEAERQLQEFHQKAVEQAGKGLLRQEEVQHKYETSLQENKQLFQENNQLKRRIQELLEICREWELKFEYTMQDHEQRLNSELNRQRQEFEMKLNEQQKVFESEKTKLEQDAKGGQDQLEVEVRNVLRENLEKYRQLKQAYEEKCRVEGELRQMLKVAVQRNQEQEESIGDLQNALVRLKAHFQEGAQDRERAKQEYQSRREYLERELSVCQDQLGGAMQSKQLLEKENKALLEENGNLTEENGKLKSRNRNIMQIEAELDELSSTLMIKNKMLDDKNETIEQMKKEMDGLKNSEQNSTDDYNRLVRRYERQSQVIEELEGQVNQLQEELDTKHHDLKEKKHLIHLFEKEIEEIKDKQDTEIANLRAEIQDKDQNLMELIKLLDDCKENLRRKDEKLKERQNEQHQQEKKYQQLDVTYERQLQEREKEIVYLKGRLEEAQEELRQLLQEMERQKKTARENLEKLHRLFN